MTINFTLFVQIINFIIAYLIISKILLKPAIRIINQDAKEENDLLEAIKAKEDKVKDKENLKSVLWGRALNRFIKEKPLFEKLEDKIVWQVPAPKEISADLKDKLEKEIGTFIFDKVKHVEQ